MLIVSQSLGEIKKHHYAYPVIDLPPGTCYNAVTLSGIGEQSCELIEDHPTQHRSLPDCLVLGWLTASEPLHAVVAIDQDKDRILIVTVYRPSEEEWEHDWRTRTA